MAVDKNKVIAEATKFAQRGQWDRAIKAYEKILADDPKDVRILLKVGELHQKRGDVPAAGATFNRVAEAYTDQGFFLKAIAVYKQMLKLAPEDARVNEKLAGLYQQLGIMSDAMAQLQLVAQGAEKAGDQGKLLDTLKRMAEIEPDNVGSAVKLGEVYARQGQTALALEAFRRAAEQLKKNNRADEYLRVAERISFLAPDDMVLTRELAHIHLSKGDTKRALSKLQLCFKANPKDVETLDLLAQAFRDLGQITKTVSVFRELALVYTEQGRGEDARATWQRVLDLVPDDADALAGLRPSSQPPRGAAMAPPASAQAIPAGPPPGARQAVVTPPPPPPARPAAAAPKAVAPAPADAKGSGPVAIPKLLTETDVYVKYGLHQKALDHLRKVFEIDPDHLDAREKARNIRAAAGDTAGAIEEAARYARLCVAGGLGDRAESAIARLRELAPNHPDLAELDSGSGITIDVADPGELDLTDDASIDLVGPDEIAIEPVEAEGGQDEEALAGAASVDEDGVTEDDDVALMAARTADHDGLVEEEVDEPLSPPAAAPRRTPVPSPPKAASRPPPPGPPPVEARSTSVPPIALVPPPPPDPFSAPPPPSPAGMVLTPPPVARPAEPRSLPRPGAQARRETAVPPSGKPPAAQPPAVKSAIPKAPEAKAPEVKAPAVERRQPASAPVQKAAPPVQRPQQPEDEPLDISDELGEAEFFLKQGLVDEAREALQNLLTFYPDHPAVMARLAELDRKAAPPAAVAPQDDGRRFDIGQELADELGTSAPVPQEEFQYSVEEVFSQFKKGVAQTVKAEDTDTHYDLGIAYKEMGLIDDAVQEFETALAGAKSKKQVDCLSMIALCRIEKSDVVGAIQAWRRALKSDGITPEAGRAIHYELAAAHRAQGDAEAALWYFQKVVKNDPRFRDAAAQLAELGGGPGRPPAEEAPQGTPARGGAKRNIGYV